MGKQPMLEPWIIHSLLNPFDAKHVMNHLQGLLPLVWIYLSFKNTLENIPLGLTGVKAKYSWLHKVVVWQECSV